MTRQVLRRLASVFGVHLERWVSTCVVVPCVWGLACAVASDDEDRFDQGLSKLRVTATVPTSDADDVDPRTSIDLCWSGRLDPRRLIDTSALLSSGRARFDSELELQLFPWRDPQPSGPAERNAAWCAGSVVSVTPSADLREGIRYRVILTTPPRGWNGEDI